MRVGLGPWALFGLVLLAAVVVAFDGVVIALAARGVYDRATVALGTGGGGLGLGGLIGYAFGRSERGR